MKLSGFLKDLWDIILTVLIAGAVVFALRTYVVTPFIVDGHSMDYTLADGERIFMWKLAKVDRFDIVVIPAPSDPDKLYIKRVIGMPGDTIEYKDDVLYLNGQALEEPYLAQKQAEYSQKNFTNDFTLAEVTGQATVPEGKIFVMGDNRQNSLDGRSFGFVDKDSVKGQADLVIWPLDRLGLLDKYEVNADGQLVKK